MNGSSGSCVYMLFCVYDCLKIRPCLEASDGELEEGGLPKASTLRTARESGVLESVRM